MQCLDSAQNVIQCPTSSLDPWTLTVIIVAAFVAFLILWCLVGYPKWRVWASHQSGLADLANARNEQQVQVAQAQGRLDAANLNKQSAIIEAQAVSAQIKEIGEQLHTHDLYLRWQWIRMMEQRGENGDTIYVPTEANLPVLEAGRLGARKPQESESG